MAHEIKWTAAEIDGKQARIAYCAKHKEYFSNNCSECMLEFNEPEIRQEERARIAKMLREGKAASIEDYPNQEEVLSKASGNAWGLKKSYAARRDKQLADWLEKGAE